MATHDAAVLDQALEVLRAVKREFEAEHGPLPGPSGRPAAFERSAARVKNPALSGSARLTRGAGRRSFERSHDGSRVALRHVELYQGPHFRLRPGSRGRAPRQDTRNSSCRAAASATWRITEWMRLRRSPAGPSTCAPSSARTMSASPARSSSDASRRRARRRRGDPDSPWEAESMAVADLLMSQHRWGTPAAAGSSRVPMSENKTIGSMTERQRRTLAVMLGSAERGHAWSATPWVTDTLTRA